MPRFTRLSPLFCLPLVLALSGTASAQTFDASAAATAAAGESMHHEDEDEDEQNTDEQVILRYTLDPLPDVIAATGSVLIALGTQGLISTGELGTGPMGESSRLLGIDRWIADLDAPLPGASLGGNLTAAAMSVYLSAHLIRAGIVDGWREGLTEFFLVFETLAVVLMVDNFAKLAIRRARPDTYGAPPTEETDAFLSFYSGHAAFSAAVAGLTTHFLWTRDPGSVETWLGTLGIWAAAIGVGVTRMLARRHFTSDVIMGWAVGASLGLLVPHFHQSESMTFTVQSDGQTQASVIMGGLF